MAGSKAASILQNSRLRRSVLQQTFLFSQPGRPTQSDTAGHSHQRLQAGAGMVQLYCASKYGKAQMMLLCTPISTLTMIQVLQTDLAKIHRWAYMTLWDPTFELSMLLRARHSCGMLLMESFRRWRQMLLIYRLPAFLGSWKTSITNTYQADKQVTGSSWKPCSLFALPTVGKKGPGSYSTAVICM